MDIRINKDIAKEYPDDMYKGFSIRQILCIGTAMVLGGGTVLLLYYAAGLNIHIAVYGAFPLAAPVILAGFIHYKGMPLLDAFREWVRLADQPVMAYEAQENHYDCLGDQMQGPEEEACERRRQGRKRMKKEKKKRSGGGAGI